MHEMQGIAFDVPVACVCHVTSRGFAVQTRVWTDRGPICGKDS